MLSPENLTMQMIQFGRRMRELRKHRNLTLQEIEKVIGISNSKLSKIENGMANVEFQTMARIADALDVPVKELFNFDGALPL